MSKGPVGIVTGAASGIGAGTAFEFAKIGARLALVDQRLEESRAVLEHVRELGGDGTIEAADVRDLNRLEQIVQRTSETFGQIDFLVANAGVTYQSNMAEGDPDRWQEVMDTNVMGAMLSVRSVLPSMIAREDGHIFLMASIAGRFAHVGEPAYIASKFALVGFGHALRMEVEPASVRVTLVEPGLVETGILAGNPRVKGMLERMTPLKPEDVGRAIVFAFQQPPHVSINELAIRPTHQ